jgi:hypothetical protein
MKELKGLLKFGIILFCAVFFFGCVAEIRMAPRPEEPAPPPAAGIRPWDLKVLQLRMSPDPVQEGQRVSFRAVVSNLSQYSGRASFFIKDRDEIITQVYDVFLRPGENRVIFPQSYYQFSRNEYCFTVEVDIERTRRPVDVARQFCARRTYQGWTMASTRVGPFFVEDLETLPDPIIPGQQVRFKLRLRNDGTPVRANLRIQDRDQVVAQLNNVLLPSGVSDFYFPFTQYQFQRFDLCFTVTVDIERTPYRVDAARQFCAKPKSWTLRP